MSQIEMKNAIQMAHLANLSALAQSIPETDKDIHVIGYVIGKAKGVSYRANPNGNEPSIGINGVFEAIPAEEGRPVMRAPMIYLPTAFSKMLAAELVGDQETPSKAPPKGKSVELQGIAEVQLALEIGIRRNNGAGVGYEFSVVNQNDDSSAQDALAEMRALLPKDLAKMTAPKISGPVKAALPAPTKKKKTRVGRSKK